MSKTISENSCEGKPEHPAIVLHFRTVGKISLYTGLVTAICLFFTVYYLAGSGAQGKDYSEIFSAYALTKKQLGTTMFISGMILVTITGVITWIIVLYSTFRVAGPLHWFSKNLDEQIMSGPVPVNKKRSGNRLHEEHLRFSGGASRLQLHYDAMSEWVDLAKVQLQLPETNLGGGLTETIKKLQELDRLVKL